ncbi:MAG: hypothetical protein AAF633_03095 [Chloroflexota bacterium]
MAQDSGTVKRHEIEGILSRLEWLDEERSKLLAQTSRLQNIVDNQERLLDEQRNKIDSLENRILDMAGTRAKVSQIDTILEQFKDEIVNMIDQYDSRQKISIDETNRLRRVENDVLTRELRELRAMIREFDRLHTDMELRQAEESRLSNLLGSIQSRITLVENKIDSVTQKVSFIGESEQQRTKMLNHAEASVTEIRRHVETAIGRTELFGSKITKIEASQKEFSDTQDGMNRRLKEWADQIQLGEYERNQRLENMQQTLKEFQTRMTQFAADWAKHTDLYNNAQSAIDTLDGWKNQMDTLIRESVEANRIETNRMQTRWDNFLSENEKRWRNMQVDLNQNSSTFDRQNKQIQEQLQELQDMAKQLDSERDALWRVQGAQLDAIKQLPRLWLQEVEKARQMDPNRRREPSLVAVEEDLY